MHPKKDDDLKDGPAGKDLAPDPKAPTVLYRANGADIPLIPHDVQEDGKADLYSPEEKDDEGKPVLKVAKCPRADEPTEGHYLNPKPPKKKEEKPDGGAEDGEDHGRDKDHGKDKEPHKDQHKR